MVRVSSFWVAAVVVSACGGGNTTPLDAASGDAPRSDAALPDGPADAAPDAYVFPDVPPAAACAGTPLLPASPIPVVGMGPTSLTLGDFNGDGKNDIATASSNSDSVSVVLGAGDGSFASAVGYSAGSQSRAIRNADVDGDGDLDLLFLTPSTNELVVMRNNGSGVFAGTARFTTSAAPALLVVGDLDNDGDVDAVTLHRTATFGYFVAVLLGDGTGAFGAPATHTVAASPSSMVLADVDGNGSRDIIMASSDYNGVMILRNQGNATFMALETHPIGYQLRGVAAGDIDGDSKIDVVVAATSSNGGIRYLRGNGDGSFQAAVQISTRSVIEVALADMNTDGKLDVVGQNWDVVVILHGQGNGTFGAERVAPGQYESRLAIGTLDANPRPDIALALYAAGAVDILLDDGAGSVRSLPRFTVVTGMLGSVYGLAAGDFDGDHAVDLAVLSGDGGATAVLRLLSGNGAGGFTLSPGFTTTYGSSLTAADLDGDGRTDLFSPRAIYRNTASGWSESSTDVGSLSPQSVIAADVNGDGKLDLVFGGYQGWAVRLGTTAGFGAPIIDTAAIAVQAAVDVNADGKLDLIAGSVFNGTAELRLGNGNGTFQSPLPATGTVAADFNGDGKIDLAGTTGLARGNGDGTFQAVVPYSLDLDYLAGIRSLDLDRDGKLDLLALNGYGTMSFLRGKGDGTFEPRMVHGTAGQATGFALADFDRSGTIDVATSGYSPDVTVFFQTGCKP